MARPRPSLLPTAALLSLSLALVLVATGCAERAKLVVELRGGGLILASQPNGRAEFALLDGDSGSEIVVAPDVRTADLAAQVSLFDALELGGDQTYRLRVVASVPGACNDSDGRAVGVSPPFRYDASLARVPVYVDCADSSQLAGNVRQPRLYHTATWVPQGGPYGSVLLVGGARWDSIADTLDLAKAKPYDSIERYDADSDSSQLLTAKMARPRFYQQAVRSGDDVVVLGGIDITTVAGGVKGPKALDGVERISVGNNGSDRVSALEPLANPHALHTALALAPDRVLVVGGMLGNFLATIKAELYDPVAGKRVAQLDSVGVHYPGVAAALGDRALVYAGAVSELAVVKPQAQRFCLTSGCSCEGGGQPPCFERLPGLPVERTSLAAALVQCPSGGGGALYLVGGRRDEREFKQPGPDTVFGDIYCVDAASPGVPRLVGQLDKPRAAHTVTVVRGGAQGARLFVAGGFGPPSNAPFADAELVDVPCACPSAADALKPVTVALKVGRISHTATLLPDGSVLLVGGVIGTESVERFVPDL